MPVYGVDLSSWEGGFSPRASRVPLGFTILKASEGNFRDTRFNQFVQSSAGQVPYIGAYHYIRSGVPLSQQLQTYLAATAGKPIAFNAVDFEAQGNQISPGFAQQALALVNAIQQRTGKPTYLYTNQSLFQSYFQGSGVPLWLSAPSGQTIHANPTFVQTSFNAPAAQLGVSGARGVDLNVFQGTLADLGRVLGAQGGSSGPVQQTVYALPHVVSTQPLSATGQVVTAAGAGLPQIQAPSLPGININLLPKNVTDFLSGLVPAPAGQPIPDPLLTVLFVGLGLALLVIGVLMLVLGVASPSVSVGLGGK